MSAAAAIHCSAAGAHSDASVFSHLAVQAKHWMHVLMCGCYLLWLLGGSGTKLGRATCVQAEAAPQGQPANRRAPERACQCRKRALPAAAEGILRPLAGWKSPDGEPRRCKFGISSQGGHV